MREEKVFQPGLRGLDTNLLAALFFVMVFGFVMIYSASYYTAGLSATYNYDFMYLLKNQVAYSLIGIAAMFVVSNINYHVWSIFAIPGYVVCILLILLLKTPLGVTVKGATRWLRIGGIQFQVAEPVKLIMIVVMATLIVVWGRQLKSWLSILRMMVPSLIVSLLILRISNNMSTAAILLGMTVFMIYIVHPDQWRFFLLAAIAIVAVAAIVYYVENLDPATLEDAGFRFARIRAWLEPYEYEQDTAYQSLQGLYAIGSGGLFGKGLGNSIQKLGTIPEPYNDYIFAIICEELGVFGAGLIILLFIYLLYRIYVISQTAEDLLGRMISIGVLSHIALQVILNMMVVTGLFPTTGVTLPFFSYGGTASIFLLIEIGLVLSVNKWSIQKRLDNMRRGEGYAS
ncbi:MAG: FtsW/RodA/SpoVE family cell cycle protein [Lachnospiraceae bacterium]|nr:FtsW/RodA/SpoVE family cell cycle protein [Lachnospiraceae bacterium]